MNRWSALAANINRERIMNKTFRLLAVSCGLAITSWSVAWGDDPKVKSKKEQEAFVAMQQTLQISANDPTAQLKAIDDFLANFADTQFKVLLLENAMQIAQDRKKDAALATTYAERLLEADAKSFEADVTLATLTAQNAKEFDLDKAEKTAKVQKYAQAVYDNTKDYPKPISTIPEEQWTAQKKTANATAHMAVGLMDMVNKKYDDAIGEYKTALEITPDSIIEFRLGEAYMKAKKWDEADATFDKVLSTPNAGAVVKQYAQQKKADIAKLKAAPAPK
jgi:tetratricopeptide (TPR) repeat protein